MHVGSKLEQFFSRPFLILLFIAGTSLAALSAPTAQAAAVTLSNGDHITGKLIRLSAGTLTLKSALLGEVKIPWKEVSKLVADEGTRVQLRDGSTLSGTLVLDQAGTLAVDPGNAAPVRSVKRQDLAALNPPITTDEVKYSGRLDLGGAFNRGNSTADQLNVNGELVARTVDRRYTLGVEVNEADSDEVTTTSNRRLMAKYDRFFTQKRYLFASAEAERDELSDLKLRSSFGLGYGHQFAQSDLSNLSGEVGLNYVREDYVFGDDDAFPTFHVGFKYDRAFFDKKLFYFQNLEVDTKLSDTQDTLVRNRLGLRIPIAKGVNVSTQLNVDYDNQPAPGTKKTDSALVVSIGYGF